MWNELYVAQGLTCIHVKSNNGSKEIARKVINAVQNMGYFGMTKYKTNVWEILVSNNEYDGWGNN